MENEIEILKKQIASELRKLRAGKKYTQEEVSEKAKLNIGTVVRYENGTTIQNLDKLVPVLKIFGLNIATFFNQIYENMYRNDDKKERSKYE